MSKSTNKIDHNNHEELRTALLYLLAISVIVIIGIIGLYFVHFASADFSQDQEVWGQFGDFVGGTLNPILSFLSFIALLFTILLQSRQLAISSKELELTRDELKKAAEAQVLSEKALTAQAKSAELATRLNSINFLLDHYRIEEVNISKLSENDPDTLRIKKIASADRIEKITRLRNELEALYKEIVG